MDPFYQNAVYYLGALIALLILYTMFVGIVYCILFLAYSFVYYLLAVIPMHDKPALPKVKYVALFFAVLIMVGNVMNILWTVAIHGRVYEAIDYAGLDCLPFIPISQTLIDAEGLHAPLYGVTMRQLQYVWLVFAICTWFFSVLTYRALRRRGNRL